MIDINKIYQEKGYQDRKDFIKGLVEDSDVHIEKALNICDNEHFDRLVWLLNNVEIEKGDI